MRIYRNAVVALIAVFAAGVVLGGCPADKPTPKPAPPVQPPPKPAPPVDPVDPPVKPQTSATGDVELIVSSPPGSRIGTEYEYSIIARNKSKAEVKNVVVTDILPRTVEYVSSNPPAKVQGPMLTWEFASLGAYGTEYLRVTVRATHEGDAAHRASIRADGGVGHESTSTTAIAVANVAPVPPTPPVQPPPVQPPPVDPPAGSPTLSVVQTCEPTVLVCDPILFKVQVENIGTVASQAGIVVSDLPEGLTTRDGSRSISISVSPLRGGEKRDVQYEAIAQRTGRFASIVTIREGNETLGTASCALQVTQPLLSMRVEVPSEVAPSTEFEARITVENRGDGDARALRVQALVPSGSRFISASDRGQAPDGRTVAWDLTTLAPGRSTSVTVRLGAPAVGTLQTDASAEAYCAERVAASGRTNLADVVPPAPPDSRGLEVVVRAPATVSEGDTFDCAIDAENTSATLARAAAVRVELPTGLEYVSSNPRARISGTTMTWDLGDLRQNDPFPLSMTVRATQIGQIEACAELSTQDGRSKRHCATTTVRERTSLALKFECPETILVCDPLEYHLVVTNNSARNLSDVIVDVQLPDGLATDRGERSVRARIGTVRARESRQVTFSARASKKGAFEVRATATASGGERSDSTCSTTVTQPVLQLTTTGPEKAAPGDTLQYSIAVKNTGDAAAADCVLENSIPEGTTFESANGGGTKAQRSVTWKLGQLEVGAEKTVTLTLKASDARALQNTVTAKGYCCEDVTATAATSVDVPPPTLRITCALSRPQIRVGKTFEATIVVVNNGKADATNVAVTCALPRIQSAASAAGPAGVAHRIDGRKVTFDPIGKLRPGEKARFTVTVNAAQQGEGSVVGVVRADGLSSAQRTQSPQIRQIKR